MPLVVTRICCASHLQFAEVYEDETRPGSVPFLKELEQLWLISYILPEHEGRAKRWMNMFYKVIHMHTCQVHET